MTLKDIEFLIDNYKFNVIINHNQENNFKIRINAEIAYIYSDNYPQYALPPRSSNRPSAVFALELKQEPHPSFSRYLSYLLQI